MKISRNGCELQITLDSGIGYTLTFSHGCNTDADAEAWRIHLQARQDLLERMSAERAERRLRECQELRHSNAAYRGITRKLRAEMAELRAHR